MLPLGCFLYATLMQSNWYFDKTEIVFLLRYRYYPELKL